MRYRRSPHLACHWSEEGLVIQDWAGGRSTLAPPFTVTLLDALSEWRSPRALAALFTGAGEKVLARALAALQRRGLVEREGARAQPKRAAALAGWRSWSPAAALLHFSTKDADYAEHGQGERDLVRRARADPPPPAAKRAPRGRLLALPAPLPGALPSVLCERRTWRRFARAPLEKAHLATLLRLTFGVQGWMDLPGLGPAALKTSPSGGARHSIEAYLLARRVEGLAPGLCHYDAVAHGLEPVSGRRGAPAVSRYLPRQPWFADAPAVVFMAAVFPRVQWRYGHPRAYRVVLAEAGHLCQTFLLLATWLGLAPFCTMALADTRIEEDLGLDGIGESVLYAAGVGKRPRGALSGQAPVRRRGGGAS